jgi:hypothetical protein
MLPSFRSSRREIWLRLVLMATAWNDARSPDVAEPVIGRALAPRRINDQP